MEKDLLRLEETEEKFGVKKSRTIAKLDFWQSVTGLILGVFILGHIVFESSILVSKELMYKVTIMFEGYYFFGEKYPGIISFLAASIFTIFIVHAAIAMRKFPSSYRQYKIMKQHAVRMEHNDTYLWLVQVITGFIMFFTGSIHLFMMMLQPQDIGPYVSANRIVHDMMWILYVILLVSVVLHAFIGLYRLALKWGFFEGTNAKKSRKRHKALLKIMIAVYLSLGFLALGKYIYVGMTHDVTDGARYKPKTIKMEKH
jgi:fumarate reductase subunit C